MRILHTSDWHLGRSFGPVSLLSHQAAFADWLVGVVAAESVDLVVVAGDVYDRAFPPNEAVVLFRETLRRLRAVGARVAVITGNHDAADRVDTYNDLLDSSGVLLRGGYSKIGEVLRLDMADGPLDLVLLPFLDPQAAPDHLPHLEGSVREVDAPRVPVVPAPPVVSDQLDLLALLAEPDPEPGPEEQAAADAFAVRMRRTHQSVLRSAVDAVAPHLRAPRSLSVAHAFVTGGATCDSERALSVGGSGTVDAALFRPFSYTALGHLHQPQAFGHGGRLRYSGTPLAYSFSETHEKSVTLVEMAPSGACTATEIAVPVGRRVLSVSGTMDELLRRAVTAEDRECFVQATVTDGGVVLDARQRLATVYPHVVEIVLAPPQHSSAGATVVDRRRQSPLEIADLFWQDSTGSAPTEDEQAMLHAAIAEAVGVVG